MTGQLGDTMKESSQAAQNWVLCQAASLGIGAPRSGIHIHVPPGAILKDGPSAGVTNKVGLST